MTEGRARTRTSVLVAYAVFVATFGAALFVARPAAAAFTVQIPASIERVSVDSDEQEYATESYIGQTNGDGSLVWFDQSGGTYLVRDRVAGTTEVALQPPPDGPDPFSWADVTPDGRYWAFRTTDPIDPSDDNGTRDIYRYDTIAGTYEWISIGLDGAAPDCSAQFTSDQVISDDGRFVVFESSATNLVTGDTNQATQCFGVATAGSNGSDLFLRDVVTGTTTRLTVEPGGAEVTYGSLDPVFGAAISGDGSTVVFGSEVQTFAGPPASPCSLSECGMWMYAYDVSSGANATYLEGVNSVGGVESVSDDGTVVGFKARELIPDDNAYFESDVYWYDAGTDTYGLASVRSDGTNSWVPTPTRRVVVSGNGRFIGFHSDYADSLVDYAPTTDFPLPFIHDRTTGITELVSRSDVAFDDYAYLAPTSASLTSISDSGAVAVWQSGSPDIIAGDTNNNGDVFVTVFQWDRQPPTWPAGASLNATDVGATQVALEWSAATDAGGVERYRVYRNGSEVTTTPGLSTTVTGLDPETTYTFSVQAEDAFGNVTTDGPTTDVTTTSGGQPGTAILTVSARSGGIADLSWEPAPAQPDAYAVYRTIGTGAETQVDTVAGDVVTYRDSGLPSGADVTYRVTTITGGAESAHTAPVTVTTPDIAIDAARLVLPLAAFGDLVPAGTIRVILEGEPNRSATATIAWSDWYDGGVLQASPIARETEVTLTEVGAGVYAGDFVVPSGTAAVQSASATLADGYGATASASPAGLPRDVAGSLRVDVQAPDATFPPIQVVVLQAGTIRAQAVVDTTGVVDIGPLPEGTEFTVRAVDDASGRTLSEDAAPDVVGGLPSDTSITPPLPAWLDVVVTDTSESGAGLANAEVLIIASDGTPIGMRLTGSGGAAARVGGLVAGDEVTVSVDAPYHPFDAPFADPDPVLVTLTAGLNRLPVPVGDVPIGTVSGTLRDGDGAPAAGRVDLSLQREGAWHQASTTTTDGTFSFDVPVGDVVLSARSTQFGAVPPVTVSIPETGATRDLRFPPIGQAEITLRLFTRYAGEDFVEVPMDGRTAWHFRASAKSLIDRAYRQYPLAPDVPGQSTVTVCVDGAEFDLPAACQDVELDANLKAEATFQLEALAGITATLVRDGLPYTGPWTAHVRVDEPGTWDTRDVLSGLGADLSVPLARGGTVQLEVVTDDGASATVTRSVAEGAVADFGQVELANGDFAGSAGNGMAIVDGEYAAGATVEVRTTVTNSGGSSRTLGLRLTHPTGTSFPTDGTTVDGIPVPATVSGRDVEVALGTVDPGETRIVRTRVHVDTPSSSSLLGFGARIVDGGTTELLGVDALRADVVTIYAPRHSPELDVTVSGTAPVGELVDVMSDSGRIVTTSAGLDGTWTADVTLPDLGPWHEHELWARMPASGQTSSTVVVQHDPTYPVPVRMVMQQLDGRRFEVDPREGPATLPFTFAPGQPLLFEVEFSNPDRVREPAVMMNFRQVGRLSRGTDGLYRARIDPSFDDLGPIWITNAATPPGDWFSRPAPTPDDLWNLPLAYLANAFREAVTPATAAATSPGETLIAGSIASGVELIPTAVAGFPTSDSGQHSAQAGGANLVMEWSVSLQETIYEQTDADLAYIESTGSPFAGRPTVDYSVGTSTASGGATAYIPVDALGDLTAGSLLSLVFAEGTAGVGAPEELAVTASPAATADVIEFVFTFSLAAYDAKGAGTSLGEAFGADTIADQILALQGAAAACGGPAGPGLRAKAQALEDKYIGYEAVKLGLAAASVLAGLSGPGAIAVGGASFLIAMELDDRIADAMEDLDTSIRKAFVEGDCDEPPPPPEPPWVPTTPEGKWGKCIVEAESLEQLGWCGPNPLPIPPAADPEWIHDPSGFVYEAIESNRLSGVTATLLRGDTSSGPWTAWDSVPYGQINPQATDVEGRYGWDVPEGWWQVVYSLDGYQDGASDVLQVLPPHFDVNVGLVRQAAPAVAAVTVNGDGSGVEVVFDTYMVADTLTGGTITLSDPDGAIVASTVAPVDAEASPTGTTLARRARLTATGGLTVGTTYTVRVDESVTGYNGRPLVGPDTRDVTVSGNTAPVAADDAFQTVEDVPLVAEPGVLGNDGDADGHELSATVVSGPAHGTIDLSPDGTFVYEPEADFAGTDGFTYAASDPWGGSAEASVTIEVAPSDDPPVANGDEFAVSAGSVLAGNVLDNDTEPDGDLLSAYVVGGPPNGAVDLGPDGSFEYVPASGFVGTDFFTYRIWDGTGRSNIGTVLVTVIPASGGGGGAGTAPPPGSGRFVDDDGNPHEPDIETIAGLGITVGCDTDGPRYCPGDAVTRAQMAAFIVRALGGSTPAYQGYFPDVGSDVWFAGYVERLYQLGVVVGYPDGTYRPNEPVSRAEVAAMLARAFGAETLPTPSGDFSDVPEGAWYAASVEELRRLGITRGCGTDPLRYCPDDPVLRDQMASFLARALGLGALMLRVPVERRVERPIPFVLPYREERIEV